MECQKYYYNYFCPAPKSVVWEMRNIQESGDVNCFVPTENEIKMTI